MAIGRPMQGVILLDITGGDAGHRGQYFDFLGRLLNGRRVMSSLPALFAREPVLFPMIEESIGLYAVYAAVRSLLGRRTAGLLFRPLPVVEGASWRQKAKQAVLRCLRALPRVATLTILPFSVDARFASIAHDWIYDLQFWDLHVGDSSPHARRAGPLAGQILAEANGRSVCVALGRQDRAKGFDIFARAYVDDPSLRERSLFAFGGKVDDQLGELASAFEQHGGKAIARFVSDEELLDLYAAADLVWSCYAPDYDQASGIFGRAMQSGLPVVVRAGSLIHRFAASEGVPHLAFDPAAPGETLAFVPPRETPEHAAERARRHAAESCRRLSMAVGQAPEQAPRASGKVF
ncbi:MAG TPA: hypothetical protein VN222_06220 [Novosphingobium sp.]|nr:hypothetical protein [Novosphingobium sp.]